MKTVTINKKNYPIHFNELVILNFGEIAGFTKMSEIQQLLMKFSGMGNDIEINTIKLLAKLVFCGFEEGCDIKGIDFDLTEKIVLRDFLANTDKYMTIITDEMTTMADGQVGEAKAKVRSKKK